MMIRYFFTNNMAMYGDITPFAHYFHFVFFQWCFFQNYELKRMDKKLEEDRMNKEMTCFDNFNFDV